MLNKTCSLPLNSKPKIVDEAGVVHYCVRVCTWLRALISHLFNCGVDWTGYLGDKLNAGKDRRWAYRVRRQYSMMQKYKNLSLWYRWNTVLYLHKFSTAWILLFLHKQGAVGEWIPSDQSNIITLNLYQGAQ